MKELIAVGLLLRIGIPTVLPLIPVFLAIVLPLLSVATWPAMNRSSDALTRVICEYWPSGLPSASGL